MVWCMVDMCLKGYVLVEVFDVWAWCVICVWVLCVARLSVLWIHSTPQCGCCPVPSPQNLELYSMAMLCLLGLFLSPFWYPGGYHSRHCELPDMAAGNRTPVFYKKSHVP